MKKILLLVAGMLFSVAGFAKTEQRAVAEENEFTIGVQIRPRAEYRNGVLFPRATGEEPAWFINNRAHLSMGYERDRLSVGLAVQHVGVWGQDPQIDKNGRVLMNEAWVNLDMGAGLFMKLGRQALVYDDERILGSLDWNVAGRFHDALKLGYEDAGNKLHLILSFNQNDERIIGGTYYAPGAQPYKNMQTLWYQYTGQRNFKASFLVMNLGLEGGNTEEQQSDTKYMQTFGTNLNYRQNGLSLGGTFYYQSGKTKADQTIAAYMWAVNAGYEIDSKWKVSVGSD